MKIREKITTVVYETPDIQETHHRNISQKVSLVRTYRVVDTRACFKSIKTTEFKNLISKDSPRQSNIKTTSGYETTGSVKKITGKCQYRIEIFTNEISCKKE